MTSMYWILTLFFCSMTWAQDPLRFSQACSPEENIEISAVGDVLLHSPLQIQATKDPNRFASLWFQVLPMLQSSDLTYANLEGPSAPGVTASGSLVQDPGFHYDGVVYSSYPQFNYHPFLIDDLQRSGVDVVSTANNHALDRLSIGVDFTIEQLSKRRMAFSGTRSTRDLSRSWAVITPVRGRRIAWLACSFSTNGINDRFHQVLPCYENPREIFTLVHQLSADPRVDAVIVTPHWGVEYEFQPHESQIWFAHQLIEAGATAVVGTHPHVLQPWEKYTARDGREGFIMYSTGNFVSGQSALARRASILLRLNFVAPRNGKLAIRGVRFLPLWMSQNNEKFQVLPVFRFDSSLPEGAVKIWQRFYSDKQRILSMNENSPQEICKASQ